MTSAGAGFRPGKERGPALGRQHAAGRVLVRGGHHHRVDIGGFEPLDPQPGLVHGDRDDLEPERPEVLAALGLGRVLQPDPPRPRVAQHGRDQLEPLREPRAHDDGVGVGRRPTHPVEVLGEGQPQFGDAPPIEIAEPLAWGRLSARRIDRSQVIPRELVEVGAARPEVELEPRCGGVGQPPRDRPRGRGDLVAPPGRLTT